ncbi:sigma-54-dependent transcriptional regulator [Planctellipticum variicoloris]|uniref:sigma-54-dependent transcriptional regulator n=1 Tax=Planctellipticum variicoloris TaxID=3064265 RepID=UPI0030135810|nr:sigma-54 dependent transcriptional regulator [Planctomycetaceae bacterium SH412]
MTDLMLLIVDDEAPARHGMVRALRREGWTIAEAENGRVAVELIRTRRPDLVFLDLNMPELDGLGVLRELGPATQTTEIVVLTANDRVSAAVECVRLGAADFLTKPFELEQLRAAVERVQRRRLLERRVSSLQAEVEASSGSSPLLGVSRAMRELRELVHRAAAAPVDLLIRGETGAGKELVARELHRHSPRGAGPFVAVNTAALPESLLESELFGHVKGAFTGAERDREGVFRRAQGGTLFLDEIGDLPLAAQAKLLRALQERQITPVGSERPIAVDVRVVSATHQPLEELIADGRFRQDLYYRLRGFEIPLAPLRARREDILVLATHFAEQAAGVAGRAAPEFGRDAIDALLTHDWPGNVRELEHALRAAVSMLTGEVLHARDLGLALPRAPVGDDLFAPYLALPFAEAKTQLVEAFERAMVTRALEASQGNLSAAARALGMHRQSLQQKLDQLGLKPER